MERSRKTNIRDGSEISHFVSNHLQKDDVPPKPLRQKQKRSRADRNTGTTQSWKQKKAEEEEGRDGWFG